MTTLNEIIKAASELRDLERDGVNLPYTRRFILVQELGGNVVDLETGEIRINGKELRSTSPTKNAYQEV